MAWSIVGVGAVVEAQSTTLTLTEPAGVANGDLLIACIASRTTSTTAPTATGWLAVASRNVNNTLTTTSALGSGAMLYQVRLGTPTLTFTIASGIDVTMGRIVAYRGSGSPLPINVTTAVTTAVNTTAVSVAGLTTTTADELIVAMAAGGQEAAWSSFNATTPSGASGATDTTTAPSATWRERADSSTVTGADTSLAIFDAVKTTAGATGNLTATASLGAGHSIIAGAFRSASTTTADAWNINDKTVNLALSNSDKTVTNSNTGGVRSTQAWPLGTAGKYYAEFLLSTVIDTFDPHVGIKATQGSGFVSGTATAAYINAGNGTIFNSGTSIGSIAASVSSDVICLALDAGAERIWFRKNGGLWNNDGAANPATGVNGLDISSLANVNFHLWMSAVVGTAGKVVVLRTELAEYTQTVPSGFLSWMGESAAGGGVTVPVTGVSATGSPGSVTVTGKASTTVTGVSATGQVGSVTVTISTPVSIAVTGVEATGSVGSVSVVGKANVSATGVAAAGSVNAITVVGKANAPVIGVEATGSVGSVSVAGKASASVTGVQAAGAVGTVTITGKANVPVIGVEATGALGTVTTVAGTGVSVPVTGVSAAGQVGTATASGKAVATAIGMQAAGSIGSVTVTAGTGVTVPVTGVSTAGAVGSPTVTGNANVALTGVAATGAVGSVSVLAGASEAVADAWDWTRTTGPVSLSNGDKTATAEAA